MYSYGKVKKHGYPAWLNEYVLEPYFFTLIGWIQLCDKKNMTFIDCYDKILLNES